ncbi:SDR family NAD(P)-dependent oxidoreductase [Dokdonia sp. Hel_I_53]|uniref:SDR family NAD(P)-dependent oxidoreductase n=1 Tax=Dokdonia sp. Hel_I_53 TaxID=1566287 RepID=UPI00119C3C14|nr:SDR family oxidoreductase [Dokdonia sp. Hel_I_53]TVZ52716.1 hypothetical protein OD90_1900 [Dokdonia sp. Hel_I_53]
MNKTALITGASSGIGKALATIHAKCYGDLIIVARTGDLLNDLKKALENQYGITVYVIEKDLSKITAAEEIYEEVKSQGIEVDYLVNNAGFGGHGLFYEREWEEDLSMIQLNIIALTALTRKFLPDMVHRNTGKILNVSSTASLMPGPLQAVYFATKAYVTSFSNAIAEELSETNVTVTNLMPGATDTDFAETSGMEKTDLFKNPHTAEEVAQAAYKGMLEGKLNVLAGLSFSQKIMMKFIPIIPKKIIMGQVKKLQSLKK